MPTILVFVCTCLKTLMIKPDPFKLRTKTEQMSTFRLQRNRFVTNGHVVFWTTVLRYIYFIYLTKSSTIMYKMFLPEVGIRIGLLLLTFFILSCVWCLWTALFVLLIHTYRYSYWTYVSCAWLTKKFECCKNSFFLRH